MRSIFEANRTYANWSLGSVWDRLKNGFGARTKEQIQSARMKPESLEGGSPRSVSVWDSIRSSALKREGLCQFWIETPMFRVSAQKLNDLGRLIKGMPLDA